MPIQKFLYRFQPVPLYIVLILSICYFSVQLILSHFTHALTLLMASYHMLCNIFALTGSIVTIKHNELYRNDLRKSYLNFDKNPNIGDKVNDGQALKEHNGNGNDNTLKGEITKKPVTVLQLTEEEATLTESRRQEQKTRNTFGWARIEILTILIVCITLASLSFSLLVEALQTLVHIDHQDSMHLPIQVMILGFVGLLLNVFTYLLIGGYTLHQGHILHVPTICKVDEAHLTKQTQPQHQQQQESSNGELQLKAELKHEVDGQLDHTSKKQGAAELLRDISSTMFVIVCGVIVHFAQDKEHTAKFIDPVLSIFSCILVVALSYPYMKESCLILLQTIPATIDMADFESSLVKKFPQIVTYHDLHIWQLSSHKYIATVHIVFRNPKLYQKTIDEVHDYFQEHRIAHVTIQPEFHNNRTINSSTECLMQCTKPECVDKVCCKDSLTDLREISTIPNGEGGGDGGSSTEKQFCEKYTKCNNEEEKKSISNGDYNQSQKSDNKSKQKTSTKANDGEATAALQRQKTENLHLHAQLPIAEVTVVTSNSNDTKC